MDDKEKYVRAKIAKHKYNQTEKSRRMRHAYYMRNKWRYARYSCMICWEKFRHTYMDMDTGNCIECESKKLSSSITKKNNTH